MVKADASKDYYAELGVAPDCTTEDIKKQFRKLALQLHPDRHPGHEDEYTARFQGVRAAHDVLADPDQRFKYDKNRRRGNINNNNFDRPSPPRRNGGSYNAPTTPWPPPPSRTNPRRAGQDVPPTPNSGASRYTNFVPPQPPTSAKQDARVRQSVFQAWRKMNQAQQAQTAGPQKPGPQYPPGQGRSQAPPSPTMEEGRDQRYPSRAESSRPASQQRSQSSWAGNAPKKTGFDPLNRGGDEGPASRVGQYASTSRYDRPDLPPRSSGATLKRNDVSNDEVPYTEGSRLSHPYSSVRHERTEVSGSESLRRSATTREGPRMPRPNSYIGVENSNQSIPMNRRKSADATDAGFAAGFASGAPDFKLPRPATHGTDANTRAHPVYSDLSGDDSDGTGSTRAQSGKPHHGSRESGLSDASPEDGPQHQQGFSPRSNMSPSEAWAQRVSSPSSGARRSGIHENARTQDERSRNQTVTDHSKATLSTTGHGYTPTHPSPLNPDASPTNLDKSYLDNYNQEDARSAGTFEADEWAMKMQGYNWAAQPPNSPSRTSPVRQGVNSRRSGRVESLQPSSTTNPEALREHTRSPAALEQEANEQGIPHAQRHGGSSSENLAGDPMDIDTEEMGRPETRRPSIVVEDESGQRKARHVYVEPSRPEWQENPANGGRPRSHGDTLHASHPQPDTGAGSSSRSSASITMDDFRHVHPFNSGGTSGAGLGNVKDLSDNLPFPSQAAPSHPKRKSLSGSEELVPPSPPNPPSPPEKLTPASWNSYLREMTRYFRDWNTFNSRVVGILQEFSMRFVDMERGRDGNMVDDWLGAVGETESLGGWDTYVKRFQEEKRVRAHWEAALAQHESTMEAHGRLRDKVMNSQSRH